VICNRPRQRVLYLLASVSHAVFCPVCKAEYREGFTRCAECGAELIDELPPAAPAPGADPEAVVRLWQGHDPVMFTALCEALVNAGIAHLPRHLTRHQLLYFHQFPYEILVRKEDWAAARDAAAAFLASEPDAAPPAEP